MKRAIIALIISPFIVSLLFGLMALFAFPIMLVTTIIMGIPLFFLLRKTGHLQWWHAVLSGVFCGVCFIVFDTIQAFNSYIPNLDRLINQWNMIYVGTGAITGFVFWWLGIFRNTAFPNISRRFPYSTLLIFPIIGILGYIQHSIRITQFKGRVVSIVQEPHTNAERGMAVVRLTTGALVQADLSNTWPTAMVEGKCFHLQERFSTFRLHRVYELIVPFSEGGNDC